MGDNTFSSRNVPGPVSGGYSFAAFNAGGSAGGNHICGVTTEGTTYCWGQDLDGQLGINSNGDRRNFPVEVHSP